MEDKIDVNLKLQRISKNKLLDARAIDYLIKTIKFQNLLVKITEDDLKKIEQAIQLSNRKDLELIIKRLTLLNIDLMSVGDLRKLGKDYGIVNYQRLSKAGLLSAIMQKENYYGTLTENEKVPIDVKSV